MTKSRSEPVDPCRCEECEHIPPVQGGAAGCHPMPEPITKDQRIAELEAALGSDTMKLIKTNIELKARIAELEAALANQRDENERTERERDAYCERLGEVRAELAGEVAAGKRIIESHIKAEAELAALRDVDLYNIAEDLRCTMTCNHGAEHSIIRRIVTVLERHGFKDRDAVKGGAK